MNIIILISVRWFKGNYAKIFESENHMFYDVDKCNLEDKNSYKHEFLIL